MSKDDSEIKQQIERQRAALANLLAADMRALADELAPWMHDRERLEQLLQERIDAAQYSKYLWVLDDKARQITSTVSRKKLRQEQFGRDRAARPYMQQALQGEDFYLSEAYVSRHRKRPSLTAVQVIRGPDGRRLGWLGADFDLRKLPYTGGLDFGKKAWRQMKGDPAIRGGLFAQQRVVSAMDERIDEVLTQIEEMIVSHGVFHAKLHFSSSRATVWFVDDPYDYQLLGVDELIDPSLCLAFPKRPWFERAQVPPKGVRKVLRQFRKLRFADETIYLRAASLNTVNGMVGLNFSCDGSHYLPWQEFLDKGMHFWFGVN